MAGKDKKSKESKKVQKGREEVRAANKPEYVTGTGQKLWRVHLKQDCQHRICDIHNPPKGLPESDWPTHWRSDRGLMERICPHGIGHPTKAHMEFLKEMDAVRGTENAKWEGIHGCDGCCGVDFGKDRHEPYPEPEFPSGASDWERGFSWNDFLDSLMDKRSPAQAESEEGEVAHNWDDLFGSFFASPVKDEDDELLERLVRSLYPEWIDRDAQPNGIGPVCKDCHQLIDWHPVDHALGCPWL